MTRHATVRSASLVGRRGFGRPLLGLLLLGDRPKSTSFRRGCADESRWRELLCAVFWIDRVDVSRVTIFPEHTESKEDQRFESPLLLQRGSANRWFVIPWNSSAVGVRLARRPHG